jgi:DNA repair protein RecO (recombination protein O)
MLEKTKAIVLHQIKYSDSGIIVHLYTRKFGRQAALIKGMHRKKSGKHSIMFQPMFILDIEIYYKPEKEIHMLKEFILSSVPTDIHSNVMKSTVCMFLGEVLSSVLREESPHEEMFDYIADSITWFDSAESDYANFHISFLSGLSRFLGFMPYIPGDRQKVFFDMRNGKFAISPPVHSDYASQDISSALAGFFDVSFEESGKINLSGKQRNDMLDTIIRYYSLHLPSLKKINSLDVLKEVFT